MWKGWFNQEQCGFSGIYSWFTIAKLVYTSVNKSHRIHGAGIYANIWGTLMVNVSIYSIHGSYGSVFGSYNSTMVRWDCRPTWSWGSRIKGGVHPWNALWLEKKWEQRPARHPSWLTLLYSVLLLFLVICHIQYNVVKTIINHPPTTRNRWY